MSCQFCQTSSAKIIDFSPQEKNTAFFEKACFYIFSVGLPVLLLILTVYIPWRYLHVEKACRNPGIMLRMQNV